jgi:hypothetical protein
MESRERPPDAPEDSPESGTEPWMAGYVPPDPDEQPSVDLWRTVGGVQPWGTMLVLFACSGVFLLLAARHALGDAAGMRPRSAPRRARRSRLMRRC